MNMATKGKVNTTKKSLDIGNGHIQFKNLREFMIDYNQKYGDDFSDDNFNSFVILYRENKKNKKSPSKILPKLDIKLYDHFIKSNEPDEDDIIEFLKKYKADDLVNALKDVDIDVESVIEKNDPRRKKNELAFALKNAYDNLINTDKESVASSNDDNDSSNKKILEEYSENENEITYSKTELKTKTIKELREICNSLSIEFGKDDKKGDLINMIISYQEE